jgi:hypothetical protein
VTTARILVGGLTMTVNNGVHSVGVLLLEDDKKLF